ncbi:MAG TPA: helix-turn-helix domain-containing protein [Fimbriimonas sp.]|nr:helix-turn-helix domain-containing protein [Fimbriimonas sp.]
MFLAFIRHNSHVVEITKSLSDEQVMIELGARISSIRLNRNMSQSQLAQAAGISKRTLERLEGGQAATQLSGLIGVLRALDLLENIEVVLPPVTPSPMTLLKLQGKARKRASKQKTEQPKKPWKWGDEE